MEGFGLNSCARCAHLALPWVVSTLVRDTLLRPDYVLEAMGDHLPEVHYVQRGQA